jgi:hypothetical protein
MHEGIKQAEITNFIVNQCRPQPYSPASADAGPAPACVLMNFSNTARVCYSCRALQTSSTLLTWARELDVHFSGGDANIRVRANDHDRSVRGERAYKG